MKIEKKKIILIIGLLLFVGLIVGGTFAYWTWNSTENKSIVFNTVGNVSDYIVYDEGSSYFLGDFKPTDSYCQSVNTTISIKKTAEANNIALRATINMDVNAIGPNIANSSDVYWVVTQGDNNITCSGGLSDSIVLGSGTFFGKVVDETFKLVSDLEVTTTEQKYTIWIWINSNGTDLSKLSGETVDTNVWTQIDMVDPDEENDVENDRDIYTVTYNVNGGTNGPTNQEKTAGESVILSSTVPTRTGYTFSGWNTIANGSGTSYNAGATYSQDKDLLLYAVWTPNTYTISYNSGGGSGTTSSTSCSYGKSCTLRNNAFTKTGYTFIGWTDSESGTNVVYKDGDTILLYNKTSNMTLYALWEITTYTVSYDANYGTGEPSDQTKTYGETLTLSSVVPTREKYAFVEWNTNADGTGTSYQPGDSYSTEQVMMLFAIWRISYETECPVINGYTGTYDGNAHNITVSGGEGGTIKYSTDNTNWSTTVPTFTNAGTWTTYVMVDGDDSHESTTCDSATVKIEPSPTATPGTCASLTYTGSAQTLASGGSYVSYSNNSRTNAGSQDVTVTVNNDNYTFNDGTKSMKLSCSIGCATPTFTVSTTSLNITMSSSGSGSFTYTYNGDGTVSCSSSNTGVATCSVNTSTKTVTVTAVNAGDATITLSAGAGTNYCAASSKTVAATVKMQTYSVKYNVLYDLTNVSSTTSLYMTYSVSNGTVTVTANNDDGYGYTNGRVYLEAGVQYTFSATTSGIWGEDGSDTVEAFLMLDGTSTYYRMASNNNYTFTPTVTGIYWLRLDVNMSGKTHTFSDITIYPSTLAPQTKTYGTTLTLRSVEPTRVGYTFKGWSTSMNATSATYGSGTTNNFSYTSNVAAIMYAVWKANTYTIELCNNYDFLDQTGIVATLGGRQFKKTSSGAVLVGYAYDGVYTGPVLVGSTADSVKYSTSYDSSVHDYSGTILWDDNTYYYSSNAYWMSGNLNSTGGVATKKYDYQNYNQHEAVPLAAEDLLNDAKSSCTLQTFTYDQAQNLSSAPSRSGWTFDGWATCPTCSKTYDNNASVSNLTSTANGTVYLYARWKDNTPPTTPGIKSIYNLYVSRTFSTSGLTYDDAAVYTTTNSDPMFMFNNIGSFTDIAGAYVELGEALSSAITIQIYYSASAGSFSESRVVFDTLPAGQRHFYIEISDTSAEWNSFRFDIGTASGISYKLKYVGIVAKSGLTHNDYIGLRLISTENGSGIAYWQETYSSSASSTGTDTSTSWVNYSNSSVTPFYTPFHGSSKTITHYFRACDNVGNCSSKSSVPINLQR